MKQDSPLMGQHLVSLHPSFLQKHLYSNLSSVPRTYFKKKRSSSSNILTVKREANTELVRSLLTSTSQATQSRKDKTEPVSKGSGGKVTTRGVI